MSKEQAITDLINYLNEGGKVIFRSKCNTCRGASMSYPPKEGLHYEHEVGYYSSGSKHETFDIGGINCQDVVVFGFYVTDDIKLTSEKVESTFPIVLVKDIIYSDEDTIVLTNYCTNAVCDSLQCSKRKS